MKKISIIWIVLIQLAIAFEWLHSSWTKWAEAGFINNIPKTLEGFASKTPYSTYSDFLTSFAIPHAELFGNTIRTGELAVGIALLVSSVILLSKKSLPKYVVWLTAIACFGGAFMNINFFLASGASSPSSWGLNIMMVLVQIILGIFYIKSRTELAQNNEAVV